MEVTPSPERSTPSPPGSPRRCLPRRHVSSPLGRVDLLDEVVDFAKLIGYGVGDWQRTPLADWSRLDSRGKWVHRRCGLSVPRQAGKSHDAIIWAAFLVLEMGYSVLWTDHNYSTTCEMLARFRRILGRRAGDPDAPRAINRRVKDAKAKTAQESFELTNGGVLCFSTRTDSASLGYSFDVIFYDEAQLLTRAQAQTLNPTTTHSPHKNSQLVYTGTPTRAGCAADRFSELRREAWSDAPDDDLCWLEYGADEVGDPMDESRWYEVNPSLAEGLVEIEDVRTGVRGMKGDTLGIAQEYLGYWLPPREQAEPPLIGEGLWRETLVDAPSVPRSFERVAYGVKFSPDGSTVAVAVAATNGGAAHIELPFCARRAGEQGELRRRRRQERRGRPLRQAPGDRRAEGLRAQADGRPGHHGGGAHLRVGGDGRDHPHRVPRHRPVGRDGDAPRDRPRRRLGLRRRELRPDRGGGARAARPDHIEEEPKAEG